MNSLLKQKREEIAKANDYAGYYLPIFSYGEKVFKTIVLGFIASINDGTTRNRYVLERMVLKCTAIGGWVSLIDRISENSPSMQSEAYDHFRQIIDDQSRESNWQFEAMDKLRECLSLVKNQPVQLSRRTRLKRWFEMFAELRNKARSHQDVKPQDIPVIGRLVFESVNLLVDNLGVFKREWAYLRKTQKGKYLVLGLSDNVTSFQRLTTSDAFNGPHYREGVYVKWNERVFIGLIHFEKIGEDAKSIDFSIPNDKWNEQKGTYESISYTTSTVYYPSSAEYARDVANLGASETNPLGEFDVICSTYSNMPARRRGYVEREALERALEETLWMTDTRPIITLVGQGGVGKTWLTLEVAHRIAELQCSRIEDAEKNSPSTKPRFGCIVWFSARDVDLHDAGFTQVKPSAKSLDDIALHYAKLANISNPINKLKGRDAKAILAKHMEQGYDQYPGPILFIFDNFETLDNQQSVYSWIESNVRSPNKVIITTRERIFYGDHPIRVQGMEREEYEEYLGKICQSQNCELSSSERNQLYSITAGHPFITSLMVSYRSHNRGQTGFKDHITDDSNQILRMLFDRAFHRLSSSAKELFLALGRRNTGYASFVVESVCKNAEKTPENWGNVVQELESLSLIEVERLGDTKFDLLFIPYPAQLFCTQKINTGADSFEGILPELNRFGFISENNAKLTAKEILKRYFDSYSITSTGIVSTFHRVIDFMVNMHPELAIDVYNLDKSGPKLIESVLMRHFLEAYIQNCATPQEYYAGWRPLLDVLDELSEYRSSLNLIWIVLSNNADDLRLLSDCAFYLSKNKQAYCDVNEELYFRCIEGALALSENLIDKADGTVHSRIAWLFLHQRNADEAAALQHAINGLENEPGNIFCLRLVEKLHRVH